MRSWTPRQPSPELEEKLFNPPRSTVAPRERSARLPRWGWVAPVACAFVLALQLTAPDEHGRINAGTNVASLAGSDSSNALWFAFASMSKGLVDDFKFEDYGSRAVKTDARNWANCSMNNVNGETFKSTNWTITLSSMRTLPVALTLTNGLNK